MYLLAVFTLLVSLSAMYAQVVSLQAARMAASMKTYGQTMIQWQTAAVSMAASIIDHNAAAYAPYASTGCSLSFNMPPGNASMVACPSSGASGSGTVTDAAGNPNLILTRVGSRVECVHLPSTCSSMTGPNCNSCSPVYQSTRAQFYSVLYTDPVTSQHIVISFLPAPTVTATNPAPGFLTMASGNISTITSAALLRQIHASGLPSFSFGYVNAANQLVVTQNVYNLPATFTQFTNMNGAVAIISTADGF